MKREYRTCIFIAVFSALLLFASAFAVADGELFVNSADSQLSASLDGVYAVGSGGVGMLSEQVYALSAGGLQQLGSVSADGGGGLLYENGVVPIPGETVRVGLFYSYSEARDSGVESCVLENTSGAGFSLGSFDEEGAFLEAVSTEASRILIRPGEGSAVSVSTADAGEWVCGMDSTDRTSYLAVRPLSVSGETPLTACAGNRYYGDFAFAALTGGRLTVVNYVDVEHYVMGVCACEMTESWPVEALKAQAVAARTYVQRYVRSSVYHYTCGFDVTADTYSQVYRGARGVGDNIRSAVEATANQYLTCDGALVDAVYSAADGGATEDGANVFGNASTYLIGIFDPYEAAAENENPYAGWKVTMTPSQLGNRLGLDAIDSITPTYSRTGNVVKLELVSVSGRTATLIRDLCRTSLGLKNIRYDVSRDDAGNFVFTGSGYGHNLGMSQWGAYAMAKYYEKDYRFILGFYYTQVGLSYGTIK